MIEMDVAQDDAIEGSSFGCDDGGGAGLSSHLLDAPEFSEDPSDPHSGGILHELLCHAGIDQEEALGGVAHDMEVDLDRFFRLTRERHASPHTIAAYHDTMRLLLAFAEQRVHKRPSRLELDDLDATLVGAFLDHLEHARGNSARTRNARLAAIHSLFRFAALQHPEHAAVIQRVLAIPVKRFHRADVTYLTEPEVDALLAAPDRATWTGRRDHTLLLLAVQTGLRASELTGLDCGDVHLGTGAHISCHGKGRKDRATPLTAGTAVSLRTWLQERRGQPSDPLFPTSRGLRLSRDALERRLAKYAAIASGAERSLAQKRITLHVLRHTPRCGSCKPASTRP
jgi:integrase/recombinase XerD